MIKKVFIKASLFILVFSLLFMLFSNLLNKPLYNGIYNNRNSQMDVLFFGTSQVYCDINPNIIWQEQGIPSYNLSLGQQPLWFTYYYIKEALKYQKPKVVAVDMYAINYKEEYLNEAVNSASLDNIRFSIDKMNAIKEGVPKDERINYYLSILRYHNNWKSLKKENFQTWFSQLVDPYKGFKPLFGKFSQDTPLIPYTKESIDIPSKTLDYLNKIIQLSKQNNFELLLLKTPTVVDENNLKLFNRVGEIAKDNNITFLNYNLLHEETKLDFKNDFLDLWGHLNYFGAQKVSSHLGRFLKDKYELQDKRNTADYTYWNSDVEIDKAEVDAYYLKQQNSINDYINRINNPNYINILSVKNEASSVIEKPLLDLLHKLGFSQTLDGKILWNYIGIYDGSKIIYEDISDKPLKKTVTTSGVNVDVVSTGNVPMNIASIKVNRVENSKNVRGLNIVVYDKRLERVVDSICFDTSAAFKAIR
jgi:hypothetical protein